MKTIKRLLFFAITAVSAAAVLQELSKPEDERTWQGNVLGVPYDFRPPTPRRFINAMWNPDDPRLFTPRPFGVGWTINFARALQLIRETSEQDSDDGA
jgi:hypothetical protein